MKMKGEAPVPDTRKQQLMEDLARTKSALDRAYSNFENVVDNLLELDANLILLDINLPYMDGYDICK